MTDKQLLAAVKRYREAHFAYELWNMRSHRDYERARNAAVDAPDDWEWDSDGSRDAEGRRLRREQSDARDALVQDPPAEYNDLRRALIEEFGE